MKQVFAFEHIEDHSQIREEASQLFTKLEDYKRVMEENFEIHELPNGVVWETAELTRNFFSDVPFQR